jgi:hypothetical protein
VSELIGFRGRGTFTAERHAAKSRGVPFLSFVRPKCMKTGGMKTLSLFMSGSRTSGKVFSQKIGGDHHVSGKEKA